MICTGPRGRARFHKDYECPQPPTLKIDSVMSPYSVGGREIDDGRTCDECPQLKWMAFTKSFGVE